MNKADEMPEDAMVEAGARAAYEHWQSIPACSASKSWEQRCEDLPGSAAFFRTLSRKVLAASLSERRAHSGHGQEPVAWMYERYDYDNYAGWGPEASIVHPIKCWVDEDDQADATTRHRNIHPLVYASPDPAQPMQVTDEIIAAAKRVLASYEGFENGDGYPCPDLAALEAALSASQPKAESVPDGWVMVPREPTEAMLDAFWHQTGESRLMRADMHARAKRYHRAMLAAAPTKGGE